MFNRELVFSNNLNQYDIYKKVIYYVLQSTLVCAFPLDAIPCEESEAFMDGPTSINARFGIVDDLGREEKKK